MHHGELDFQLCGQPQGWTKHSNTLVTTNTLVAITSAIILTLLLKWAFLEMRNFLRTEPSSGLLFIVWHFCALLRDLPLQTVCHISEKVSVLWFWCRYNEICILFLFFLCFANISIFYVSLGHQWCVRFSKNPTFKLLMQQEISDLLHLDRWTHTTTTCSSAQPMRMRCATSTSCTGWMEECPSLQILALARVRPSGHGAVGWMEQLYSTFRMKKRPHFKVMVGKIKAKEEKGDTTYSAKKVWASMSTTVAHNNTSWSRRTTLCLGSWKTKLKSKNRASCLSVSTHVRTMSVSLARLALPVLDQ